MTNGIIEIPVTPGIHRLSDVFEYGILPYGILNKSIPGCGGTTVALESPHPYIVIVPTIELIKNKCEKYFNPEGGGMICKFHGKEIEIDILAIHGDFNPLKEQIELHLKTIKNYDTPLKIMVTFDSAPKLLKYLGKDIVKNCSILVDEFHSLMIDYDFRSEAIENLIEALMGYPQTTYMSATPLAPEHLPVQLEKLPQTIVKWDNVLKPSVVLEKSNAPLKSVAAIIVHDFAGRPVMKTSDHLEPSIFPEQYFFFINNVTHIKKIIRSIHLPIQDKICIVCTDNGENQKTLGDLKNLMGSTSSLKRYNFLTKRAYYGCDIHSSRGLSVVVTDIHSKVTLLDVNTDIIQISGRIRNEENPFKNILVHIYNKLPEDTKQIDYNQFEREHLKSTKSTKIDTENFRRHLHFKFFLYNETYNSLSKAYNVAQIPFHEINLKHSFFPELTHYCTGRFDENLEEIYNFYERGGHEEDLSERLRLFLYSNPIINEAIITWGGIEKLRSFRFREKDIRRAVERDKMKKIFYHQVGRKLEEKISIGKIYSRDYLISTLQEIYYSLGIKRIAKAIDISEYYEIKKTTTSKGQNGSSGAMKIWAKLSK